MKLRLVYWMLSTLVLAGMFLPGCTGQIPPTPVRSFSTMDLLIDLSDMPEGWRVAENSPSRILDYLTGRDPATAAKASRILFLTEVNDPWYSAAHDVYRFKTCATAKYVYEEQTLGETPADWTYHSSCAEGSKLLCRHLGHAGLIYCEWFAYYDEYYVEFSAALVPGKMTLTDVERIVQVIDSKMARYLDLSCQ